jgi:BRCA1-associated protein
MFLLKVVDLKYYRYSQQPTGHRSECAECGTTESLWICVVCGHVGCSRYVNDLFFHTKTNPLNLAYCSLFELRYKAEHAHEHFRQTGHTYALELATGRVWDYAGDGYDKEILFKISPKIIVIESSTCELTTD